VAPPLNPKQFGEFTPRGTEHGLSSETAQRVQAVAGGFDKLQAHFPNAKAGYYPSKANRRAMTLKDTKTAAAVLGYDVPN
jgi:hypothetical protein